MASLTLTLISLTQVIAFLLGCSIGLGFWLARRGRPRR
jgi:uncharacterized protein YneF (UPF0154 family)